MSGRRTCRAMRVERSMVRYRSRRPSQQPLPDAAAGARQCAPAGRYQQLHVLFRRDGWRVNHKRVYRLYTRGGAGAPPAWATAASQCGGLNTPAGAHAAE